MKPAVPYQALVVAWMLGGLGLPARVLADSAELRARMVAAKDAWDASCKGPDKDGFCGSWKQVSSASYCGGSVDRFSARWKKKPRAALASALDGALADYDAADAGDKQTLATVAAELQLRRGDREAELFLVQPFPTNLDFDVDKPATAKRSKERFSAWVSALQSATQLAREHYVRAATLDPEQKPHSMARAAALLERIADRLEHAHIPRSARKGPYASDAVAAYCDAVAEQARPVRDEANRTRPSAP